VSDSAQTSAPLHYFLIQNKIHLTAENKDDMAELIKFVKHNSERAGMNWNIKKTTVMGTMKKVNLFRW
jgi:hypothetical protein